MIFEKSKNVYVVLWLIKYQGDNPSGGLVVVLQIVVGSLQLNVTYCSPPTYNNCEVNQLLRKRVTTWVPILQSMGGFGQQHCSYYGC
jgi:hypothetical protein